MDTKGTSIYVRFIISVWLVSVMIDYSCNHTSWESNGPMSGVKIQMFRPNPGPSSVNNDLEYKAGRLYTCKKAGNGLLLAGMMVVPLEGDV